MTSLRQAPSAFSHVLETIIYVKDMERARHFYTDILHLSPEASSPRGTTFHLGTTVLLLFTLGLTTEDTVLSDPDIAATGKIPKHGPTEGILRILSSKQDGDQPDENLRQHFCLAVDSVKEVDAWREYLVERGVRVLGNMKWERGGESVYFEDSEGNVGEIACRGIWRNW